MKERTAAQKFQSFSGKLLLGMMALLLLFAPAGAQAKVKLSKSSATLYVGETLQLKVKGLKKKQKAKVTWKSSKKSVAKVSKKGLVTAKKKGTAKITAKIKGKGINTKKVCKIKVKKATDPRDILRSYILKKGKKDEQGDYYIEKIVDDYEAEHMTKTVIYANPKNTKMIFTYTSAWTTPDFGHGIEVRFDLKKSKKGTALYVGDEEDYSDVLLGMEGELTTAYDGDKTGITWTRETITYDNSAYADPSEKPEDIDTTDVEDEYKDRGNALLTEAFEAWNKLAKKAGNKVTMKALGFKAYK